MSPRIALLAAAYAARLRAACLSLPEPSLVEAFGDVYVAQLSGRVQKFVTR